MKLPKTWFTIALFCLFAAVPYLIPSWERFRILEMRRISAPFAAWKSGALARVFLTPHPASAVNPTVTAGSAPAAAAPSNEPLPPSFFTGDYVGKNWPVQEDVKQILQESPEGVGIQDYGCGMNHFYAVLALTEQKQPGAIARICHFGDSPISGDLISGEARTLLQDKFGDSGHGFILISKPWDFYYHEGISMEGKGWKVSSPVIPGSAGGSGSFGLGGASFTAGSPSAYSHIHTTKKGEGSEVSRFDIYYRAQPNSGSFLAYVDKAEAREFSTQADNPASAVASISVEDGGHALKITPQGDGPVTLYGVALERNKPGVVYDTLGMLGGTVHHLTRFREDTWIEDLQNRRPDLIILNFGTNESNYGYLPYAEYLRNYAVVIQRIRTALPTVSILIMAPMDRGARNDDGDIVTIPSIPMLVAAQRRVARSEGVAFFDTFAAMGGMGTMARWYEDSPRLVTGDFTHPTYTGAQQLGTMLVNALLKGFGDYKLNHESHPCVPTAQPAAEQTAEEGKPKAEGGGQNAESGKRKREHRRKHLEASRQ